MSDFLKEFGGEAREATPASARPADGGEKSMLGSIASEVGTGLTEIVPAVGSGIVRGVNEMSTAAYDLAGYLNSKVDLGTIEIGKEGIRWRSGMPEKNDLQIPESIQPPRPTTILGSGAEGISQFLTGYVMGGKLMKGAAFTAGRFAPSVLPGAVTALETTAGRLALAGGKTLFSGGAAFDPAEARLSNLINEETPFGNIATQWLAASPDDSRAEGRLKNAIENLALDIPAEALFYALKGIKAKRAGNHAEAERLSVEAEKELNKAFSSSNDVQFIRGENSEARILRKADEVHPNDQPLYSSPAERKSLEEAVAALRAGADETTLSPRAVEHIRNAEQDLVSGGRDLGDIPSTEIAKYLEDGLRADEEFAKKPRAKTAQAAPTEPRKARSDYDPDPEVLTRGADGVETITPYKPSFALNEKSVEHLFDSYGKIADDPAKLDAVASKRLWQNMSLVRDENDAKAFANKLGEVGYQAFLKAKGGKVTHEDVMAWASKHADEMADWTGIDVTNTAMMMNRDAKNLEELAKRMAGYQSMESIYRRRATDLANAWRRGDFSEFGGDKRKFMDEALSTVYTYHAIAPQTAGIRSGLGRNLSLLKAGQGVDGAVGKLPGLADEVPTKPGKMSPEAAQASKDASAPAQVVKQEDAALRADFEQALAGGEPEFDRLMQKLSRVEDAKAAQKVVKKAFEPGAIDVNNELWINALLSGPKTHAVNVISAGIKSALVMPGEQMIAGVLSMDKQMFMMGADQYWGFAKSMKEAMKLAGRSFKFGDAVLDRGAQGLGEMKQAIAPSTFGLNAETPLGALVSGFGTLVRMPGRMLTTEDELLKQLNYRARLHAMAMREVRDLKRGGGHTDDDLAKAYQNYFDQGFDADGAATNAEALSWARDATFTNSLKAETWRGGRSFGETLNSMAANHPGMRMILPFTRVPTNIMRDAWDHTPGMNMLRRQFRAELEAGGERAAMAKAKMVTGGAIWATATTMAYNGDIVGALSSDPKVRRMQEEAKILPNSFKRVDPDTGEVTYIPFGRLEPFGSFFSAVATFADVAKHADDWTMTDLASSFVASTAKMIESKTYLQGLTEVMGAISDPDRRGVSFLQKRVASYVPSLTNEFRGADYLSDPHTFAQAMKARTARNNEVDPRFNIVGEKVELPEAYGPDHLSPIAIGKPNDPALMEIARLAQAHDGGLGYPAKKHSSSGIDLTTVQMSDNKSAFARWQELIGEVKQNGRTLRENLETLFNSSDYKTKYVDGNPDAPGSKLTRTRAMIEMHRQAAFGALLKENPEFRAQVMGAERDKANIERFGPPKK